MGRKTDWGRRILNGTFWVLVIGDAWKGSAKRTRNFEFSEFSLRRIPLSFILNTGELGGFDGVARSSLPRVGPDMSSSPV